MGKVISVDGPRTRRIVVAAGIAALAVLGLVLGSLADQSNAQGPNLPLLTIDDLEYTGAFRLELGTFGDAGSGYGPGVIGLGGSGDSLFVVSNPQVSAIAEYPIVAPSAATSLGELPIAGPPVQEFSTVLDRVPAGNPQALDRIGGLAVVDGALIVNGYEYYDAPADNTHTTLALSDPDDLADSPVAGWGELRGAAHASGWISAIPPSLRGTLGATHLVGNSSGVPINGRSSMGPSAFAVDLDSSLQAVPAATALLDFDLDSPLATDLFNESLDNDLWTHLSRATYGTIIDGTRTYLTIGQSGGHSSGVSYGVPPWGGYSGYHPNERTDRSAWYWLWDVDDLVSTYESGGDPSAIRPYASGAFDAPFTGVETRVGGATWDPATRTFYLAIAGADTTQSEYEAAPLILTYSIGEPDPNPASGAGPAVMHATSCLAGKGRVDTNIVNTGTSAATYRIEFQGLSPRERTVEAGDWWRMPITGRFDGDWDLMVSRNGVLVSSQTISISCGDQVPQLGDPEFRVVNACRDGSGYLLFQFVNPTVQATGWVIDFEGVPNRSTTAPPYGQALRAVTGRPNGDFAVTLRANGVEHSQLSIPVNC